MTTALAAMSIILVLSMCGQISASTVATFYLRALRSFHFQLLNLIAILDLIYEYLSRFETGHKMFVDYQSGIARNVARNFFLSLLVYKASKTPDVDVIPI